MNRKTERLIWILLIIFLAGLSFTGYRTLRVRAENDLYEYTKIFTQVLHYVKTEYVELEDSKKLIYGAIEGLLSTLDDPFTRFMDRKDFDEMQVETKGSFGGLGIYITIRDKQLTIISPIPDTPAYKAGIKAYDRITLIDGEPTKELTIDQAVSRLRGKIGSKVTISVMRSGLKDPIKYTLVRDNIKIKSVVSGIMEEEPEIGYIRIKQFGEETASDLEKTLKEYEKKGIKGLILDMRGNPGGLLVSAWKTADMFLETGTIVSTRGRDSNQDQVLNASPVSYLSDIPVAVLVNSGSASASEIVTGALKDHKRATIVGEKTFGKGSVQTVKQMTGGTALALTTAKYYTPSGVCIHHIGIEPDIEVVIPEPTDDEVKAAQQVITNEMIPEFLLQHPKPSLEEIKHLQEQLSSDGYKMNFDLVNRLVRMEMYKDKDILYDLDGDIQLEKALEIVLQGGKK